MMYDNEVVIKTAAEHIHKETVYSDPIDGFSLK